MFTIVKTFQHMLLWSACFNRALSFFFDWFSCPFAAFSSLYSVTPMTGWKDSIDSWKDSKPPRQLIAVSFSWKMLRTQSTGSSYMFSNYKLQRPARLIHLAGSTPQRQPKLAAIALRQWSNCFLQIYFFNFFCLSKALQTPNIEKQISPNFSFYLMTEHDRFWKELGHIQFLYCTFWLSKVRCFMRVCKVWQELHHTVVYRLHHPLVVFPNSTLYETDILLPTRLLWGNLRFLLNSIFDECNVSFPVPFLTFRSLRVELWSWTLNIYECQFSAFDHSHIHNCKKWTEL